MIAHFFLNYIYSRQMVVSTVPVGCNNLAEAIESYLG